MKLAKNIPSRTWLGLALVENCISAAHLDLASDHETHFDLFGIPAESLRRECCEQQEVVLNKGEKSFWRLDESRPDKIASTTEPGGQVAKDAARRGKGWQ